MERDWFLQLELILLINAFFQIIIEAAGGIVAGVVVALLVIYISRWAERKTRVEAFGKKLVSEIELFQKACKTFENKTGRGSDSQEVMKNLALRTAQGIMDTFRIYPETKDMLFWDFLKTLLDELVLLAVKGFGDATWFRDQVKKLEKMIAEAVIEKISFE